MLTRTIVFLLAAAAPASVTFSWTLSATPKVKSQWVRCGLAHGGPYTKYKQSVGAKKTSATLKVIAGVPLFCVITAVGANGAESGGSNEISINP